MSRWAWVGMAVWAALMVYMNLTADIGHGGKGPPGPAVEVERYFGWPAVYQAELWDSDPPPDLTLRARYFGWAAVVVNVAFGLAVAIGLGIVGVWDRRGRLGKAGKVVLVASVLGLVAAYVAADGVEVHL